MGFWATLKLVLQYAPQVVSLVKQIWAWVKAGISDAEIRARLAKFDEAVTVAQNTKDTDALDGLFNPKKP